jgi:hypothetical protein
LAGLFARAGEASAAVVARNALSFLDITSAQGLAAWSEQRSARTSSARLRGSKWGLDWSNLGTKTEVLMRSKLLKVALGCGFAAALVAPALACDFHKTTAENDQPMAQSQQTTPDTPQTAQSQPAADTGSN